MIDTPENRRRLAAEIAGNPPAKQHSWHREPPKGLERMVADGDIPGVTTDQWKQWERKFPTDQKIDRPLPNARKPRKRFDFIGWVENVGLVVIAGWFIACMIVFAFVV